MDHKHSIEKSILPRIEAHLSKMTYNEQKIARFFLHQCGKGEDCSAQAIAHKLRVSVAALTRFAQKCGFHGYREFIFSYQAPPSTRLEPDDFHGVLGSYQEILSKTFSIIEMAQIERISHMMNCAERIYFYGKGSSGMVAREMKFRLMRVGLVCEAIFDDDLLKINDAILNKQCLVIAISISGKTKIVIDALRRAKQQGAKTVLLTANLSESFMQFCDEVQLFAVKDHLDNGRSISPQFPALIVFDILYANLITSNKKRERDAIWHRTYEMLHN